MVWWGANLLYPTHPLAPVLDSAAGWLPVPTSVPSGSYGHQMGQSGPVGCRFLMSYTPVWLLCRTMLLSGSIVSWLTAGAGILVSPWQEL